MVDHLKHLSPCTPYARLDYLFFHCLHCAHTHCTASPLLHTASGTFTLLHIWFAHATHTPASLHCTPPALFVVGWDTVALTHCMVPPFPAYSLHTSPLFTHCSLPLSPHSLVFAHPRWVCRLVTFSPPQLHTCTPQQNTTLGHRTRTRLLVCTFFFHCTHTAALLLFTHTFYHCRYHPHYGSLNSLFSLVATATHTAHHAHTLAFTHLPHAHYLRTAAYYCTRILVHAFRTAHTATVLQDALRHVHFHLLLHHTLFHVSHRFCTTAGHYF